LGKFYLWFASCPLLGTLVSYVKKKELLNAYQAENLPQKHFLIMKVEYKTL